MILLDTQVLLWMQYDESRIGRQARRTIDRSWEAHEAAVLVISFWEAAMLHEKGRLILPLDVSLWRSSLLQGGLVEIPVSGEIAIRANQLPGFHSDPADRLITATALLGDHTLVTSDRRILAWPGQLSRLNVRA